jgi:hypothetical protein
LVGNKLYVLETDLWTGFNPSPKLWEITLPTSTTSVSRDDRLAEVFRLHQNYPNPFNPSTTIRFSVPRAEHVKLVIYDMLGRQIRTLMDDEVAPGLHSMQWDGRDASGAFVRSGIYFSTVKTASGFMETRKMVVAR